MSTASTTPNRQKIATSVYLTPSQHEQLRAITAATGLPGAVVVRRALAAELARMATAEAPPRATTPAQEPANGAPRA